jgi:hypothetical protein
MGDLVCVVGRRKNDLIKIRGAPSPLGRSPVMFLATENDPAMYSFKHRRQFGLSQGIDSNR